MYANQGILLSFNGLVKELVNHQLGIRAKKTSSNKSYE